jgi:hypothetical protein
MLYAAPVMRLNSGLLLAFSLCLAACGGSQKPAEEPQEDSAPSAEEDSAEKEAEAPAEAEASEAEAPGKKEEASSEPSTSGPAFKRSAKDIITAPDVVFMFSFNESDMKKEAEERCDERASDDPKKRADCMSKEKNKIEADGIQFKQEKDRWYWLTIRRKGKTLVNIHKLPIEFTNETDKSIVLKPVGKDEGTLRGRGAPGETKVEVPNDYQIVITDSDHGKMVYEAKLGLIGEQQR